MPVDRQVLKRKVDHNLWRDSADKKGKDKFENWSEDVNYAKRKSGLTFSDSDNWFPLIRFDDNPPIIKFPVEIT